jgi:hypothetical protein
MMKRIISIAIITALFVSGISGMAFAAGKLQTINVDMAYEFRISMGTAKVYKSIVSIEITNVIDAVDYSLKFDEDEYNGRFFLQGRKIVAKAPVKITYKGEIDRRGDALKESPVWIQTLSMSPEQFNKRTGTVSSEAGYRLYNGSSVDYDTYFQLMEDGTDGVEFINDSIWDYTDLMDRIDLKDSVNLEKGYYIIGIDVYGSSLIGYLEVTDGEGVTDSGAKTPVTGGGAQPPVISQSEPSDWAVDEINKALAIGLAPGSIKDAGWQVATTRLAAAEAIVSILETASGLAMEDIADNFEWDLTANQFSDTGSGAVTFLKYAGVTSGIGGNLYDPNGEYTRAQIVTMIGRTAEVFFDVTAKGTNPFSDVPDWAAPYVGYAADNGITQGVGGGLISPNEVLLNENTAVFCYRAYLAFTK